MTMWTYGAVRICDSSGSAKEELIQYWDLLSKAHGIEIGLDHPYLEDLEPDIAGLWAEQQWLKFYVKGDFHIAAAKHAEAILQQQPQLTIFNVWPRVPEWRFLGIMLSHGFITQAYFVVEDASGDAANAEQVKVRSLFQTLNELWHQYVYLSSEDAVLYHIDYQDDPL